MGERTGIYRVLVGRSEGKKPLGGPRSRWEGSIKMVLQEIGWGIERNYLAQDRDGGLL
jgi:hypothetical protein